MNKYLPVVSILGIVTSLTLNPPSTLALEPSEIYAKAKEFTVQIDGEETGTGTIIERNGNSYTVLTCWHVMDTPGSYQVTTVDGSTHEVTAVENLPNIDLAVITFNTSNTYPIADLGDSAKATSGLDTYIVGYPDPFPGVPERQYFTESASVQARLSTAENGYQIIHNGAFTPGGSGGGIFDREANLIGINGESFYEGNTQKTYGRGILLETYLSARNSLTTLGGGGFFSPPQDFVSQGKRKLKQQDYQGAIAEFDQALASNPNDLNSLSGRAEAYYLQDNYEAAIQDFNKVLQLNPDNATFQFYRGYAHGQLGENEKEIADYNEALRLNPDYVDAYNNRGNSYNNLGENEKAIADYNEAIRLNPDNADAYSNRGVSYKNLGENEKAIADYNEAIRLAPDYVDAYNNRGVSYKNLGEYGKAIADYNEAIRLNPDYAMAYYNRGVVYDDLGENEKAIADYNEAIRLNPDYVHAYNNRGVSYDNLGEYGKAIADYNEAIRLNPDDANAYYNRGLVYESLQDNNKAITDFQQAADLYQQQGDTVRYQKALNQISKLQ